MNFDKSKNGRELKKDFLHLRPKYKATKGVRKQQHTESKERVKSWKPKEKTDSGGKQVVSAIIA